MGTSAQMIVSITTMAAISAIDTRRKVAPAKSEDTASGTVCVERDTVRHSSTDGYHMQVFTYFSPHHLFRCVLIATWCLAAGYRAKRTTDDDTKI